MTPDWNKSFSLYKSPVLIIHCYSSFLCRALSRSLSVYKALAWPHQRGVKKTQRRRECLHSLTISYLLSTCHTIYWASLVAQLVKNLQCGRPRFDPWVGKIPWRRERLPDSVRPHRRQSTRLPRPCDSPGKNTGVGCHFLLQCVKVKSESEVTQSCPTLSDPMDCSPLGSSVHGILQARVLEWGAIAFTSEIRFQHMLFFLTAHGLSQVALSRGYSLVVVPRLLIAIASLVVEHGL